MKNKTLVLGASENPARYSNMAIQRLLSKGHEVVAIGKLPGSVNGVEVLRLMKADPATRKTPVIMLSTTDDPREVARCYDLGCSVYITKPVDSVQFIEAIKRLGLFLQIISLAAVNQGALAGAAR